jgi:MFS family permease
MRLLRLVSLALFFESYDISMLTSALKFIAEDLHMVTGSLEGYLALIRLGALPSLLAVPLADRIGRRRVFLATVVGAAIATFVTAFTQSPWQFVVTQMLTRAFMVTGVAVAAVIIIEEFPAEHRGWAIGVVGALTATGHGMGAALFAAIHVLPGGWRALYVVGLAPLLFLPLFRRHVRETTRFTAHVRQRHAAGDLDDGLAGWYRPLVRLARTYPHRALVLALAAALFSVGDSPVYQFTGLFTQTVHGWSPGQYSTMVLLAGGFGIVGNVVAGRLGDRIGRRRVGAVFLGLYPAAATLLYQGPGWLVPVGFAAFVFCQSAALVVIRALATELFPTSHRGTSSGWIAAVQTLAWAAGLWLIGLGTRAHGDRARLTAELSLAVLVGGLVLLALPETGRRELEAISREDPAADEAPDPGFTGATPP